MRAPSSSSSGRRCVWNVKWGQELCCNGVQWREERSCLGGTLMSATNDCLEILNRGAWVTYQVQKANASGTDRKFPQAHISNADSRLCCPAEAAAAEAVAVHRPVSKGVRAAERGCGPWPRCSLLRLWPNLLLSLASFRHRRYLAATCHSCNNHAQHCELASAPYYVSHCVSKQQQQQQQKPGSGGWANAADGCGGGAGRPGRRRR